MILLTVFSIIGAIGPINTVNAENKYTVHAVSNGDYHKALLVKDWQTNEEVVGYCYNAHKSWPGGPHQTVTKFENATNEKFMELASGARKGVNLKEKILEVCYKGFPRDGIGLKKKYNLGNDVFQFITQSAIWYYTDSINPEQSGIWFSYNWMMDSNARAAYNELINTPVNLPRNYTLDLYQNNAPKFQNILSTKLAQDYIPPKTIEFSKKDSDLKGAELNGATLQIWNKKDNKKVDEWTTDGKDTYKVDLFEGNYIFRETNAPNGYDKVSDIYFSVDKDGNVKITSKQNKDNAIANGSKLTVVDKKKPIQYKSLTVTKKWELYGHQQNEIPGFVEVQLYENGNKKGNPVKLENSNNWSYTWNGIIDPSKKYEVKEVTTSNNWVSRIETGNDGNVTIYNSMKPELTVEKIVRGDSADKTAKFDFNIKFVAEDGQNLNDTFDYVIEKNGTQVSAGKLTVKDNWAKFKIGHEEKIRIKGLPPKVMYSIAEVLDGKGTFNAKYKISNNPEQNKCPPVRILDNKLDNTVTVYNDYVYIPPTGIDLNNKYIMPVAFLLITGSLLFSAIAILRFRKELK